MWSVQGRAMCSVECAGESDVEIQDSVRGKNVYIVQSSGRDTNNHLMGLLLFIQVQQTPAALHSAHYTVPTTRAREDTDK